MVAPVDSDLGEAPSGEQTAILPASEQPRAEHHAVVVPLYPGRLQPEQDPEWILEMQRVRRLKEAARAIGDVASDAARRQSEEVAIASADRIRRWRPWTVSRMVLGCSIWSAGWVGIIGGLAMLGAGLLAADRVAADLGGELEVAVATVDGVGVTLDEAERALAGTAGELSAVEARLETVAGSVDVADDLAAALASISNDGREAVDVAALLPLLEDLGIVIDGAFDGLAAVGLPHDGDVSYSEALRAVAILRESTDIARLQDQAAAAAALREAIGFGEIVLQYPLPGYRVTGRYGLCRDRCSRLHEGIDMTAPKWTPILAAADGVVTDIGRISSGAGYGVILDHDNGWQTKYFHMASGNVPVRVGERVFAGQRVGSVGSTGNSAGPHLHFEIELYARTINPELGFRYTTEPAALPPTPDGRLPVVDPGSLPPGIGERLPEEPSLTTSVPDMAVGGGIPKAIDDLGAVGSAIGSEDGTQTATGLLAGSVSDLLIGRAATREVVLAAGAVMLVGALFVLVGRRVRRRRAPA